jgi:hypothetical protein
MRRSTTLFARSLSAEASSVSDVGGAGFDGGEAVQVDQPAPGGLDHAGGEVGEGQRQTLGDQVGSFDPHGPAVFVVKMGAN